MQEGMQAKVEDCTKLEAHDKQQWCWQHQHLKSNGSQRVHSKTRNAEEQQMMKHED